MATPKQKSRKKARKPVKQNDSSDAQLKSFTKLVENLQELHRWQGSILEKLAQQAHALSKKTS